MPLKTKQIECVETHNLLKSLRRILSGSRSYDDQNWKRALYHALAMFGRLSTAELAAIRTTLRLP